MTGGRFEELPPLYAGWVDDLLDGAIPREREATCQACAMCPSGLPAQSAQMVFHPDAKCCTFMPLLPNFVVGRILDDPDPAMHFGRETVLQRVEARDGVTPLGLIRPGVYDALYTQSREAYGQSLSMRCPHYQPEGGTCGIWRHREAVCATYFCKHVRGARGKRFWKRLEQLLAAVQRAVARWCLLQLEVSPQMLQQLYPIYEQPDSLAASQLDGMSDPDHALKWREWAGREAELYVRCGRAAGSLQWKDVLAIGGSELDVLARLCQESYRELMSRKLPSQVGVGAFTVDSVQETSVRVTSYSHFDPLEVPLDVLRALPFLEAHPVRIARQRIQEELGYSFSNTLLRTLLDFEIVVPIGARE